MRPTAPVSASNSVPGQHQHHNTGKVLNDNNNKNNKITRITTWMKTASIAGTYCSKFARRTAADRRHRNWARSYAINRNFNWQLCRVRTAKPNQAIAMQWPIVCNGHNTSSRRQTHRSAGLPCGNFICMYAFVDIGSKHCKASSTCE